MLRTLRLSALLQAATLASATLGNISYDNYTCPKGYDCWNQNACPNITVECPTGIFCGDLNSVSVSPAGDGYLARDQPCPIGLICPTASTIEVCPADKYCDQCSVDGTDCSPGSICEENGYIQMNFVPLVMAIILIVVFFMVSKCQRNPGNVRKYAAVDSKEAAADFQRLSFTLENFSVVLGGKTIVEPLDAQFNAGELVAIMGTSGAGKSTIMNAIKGALPYQGSLKVNNKPASQVPGYSKSIGFVPQEDIMNKFLSARELFFYSAKTRLPAGNDANQIAARVDSVIYDLGLGDVAHMPVGDDLEATLSGGQRKRVNIGIELVANPSALFLDEPTSGLDASSAEDVTKIMSKMAASGRCVISVIHQPRFDSFHKFDKLLLLGLIDSDQKGAGKLGRTCYFGPSLKAAEYFGKVNPVLACPEGDNPANHLLDVISGVFDRNMLDAKVAKKTMLKDIPSEWGNNKNDFKQYTKTTLFREIKSGDSKAVVDGAVEVNQGAPLFRTMGAMFVRAFRVQLRNWRMMRLYAILCGVMAIILSTGFSPYIHNGYEGTYSPPMPAVFAEWCPPMLDCERPDNDVGLLQLVFFINVSLGAVTMMAGSQLFSAQFKELNREADSGVPQWLQAIVKMLVDIFIIFFYTSVFVGWWVALGIAGKASDWYGVSYTIAWCGSGFGYIISLIASKGNAPPICMVAALFWATFNGVYPPLKELGGGAWLWSLSYSRWTGEATYTIFTQHMADQGQDIQRGADYFGYTTGRLSTDLAIAWVLGIAFRIISGFMYVAKVKGYKFSLSNLLC